MQGSLLCEDAHRQGIGHMRVIELGEAKGCLAEFAVFLVGMREPFHQAVLVHKLDASTALARIEQGLRGCALATADPACITFPRDSVDGL